MTATKALTARQRAREVGAAQRAARVAKEKRVEDLYTTAFVRLGAVAAARAAVEAAELELAGALAALSAEGETQQAVGKAMELSAEEVRRLTRTGREAGAGVPASAVGTG